MIAPRADRCFVVPGEPVALARPRVAVVAGRPRLYTPESSVDQKTAIGWAAKAAGVTPADGPVVLDVVAVWLYPRAWSQRTIAGELVRLRDDRAHVGAAKITKPDADNVGKLVADALNAIAYVDDAQVWLARFATVWGPRAETHVRIAYGETAPGFPARWW